MTSRNRRPRWPAFALVILILTGCAKTPEPTTTFYTLQDSALPAKAADAQKKGTLRIAPVKLASFLATPSVVLQTSDVTVHGAVNHLWAEDLALALERTLRQRLARELPEWHVIDSAAPPVAGKRPAYRLTLELDSFHGRYDGMVLVGGKWQLSGRGGRLQDTQPFVVEQRLEEDGYPAMVRTLDAAWREAVSLIAADLSAADLSAAAR